MYANVARRASSLGSCLTCVYHESVPLILVPMEWCQLLESLVRLARTQAHDKAEEYSAALDEVKARQASLESGHLQRLMLGLVGDPLRAKMAKEATSILKGVSRSQPSGFHDNRTRRRLSPYPVQCYSCHGWGHIARNCKTGRAGGRGH